MKLQLASVLAPGALIRLETSPDGPDEGEPAIGTVMHMADGHVTAQFDDWYETWPVEELSYVASTGLRVARQAGEITDMF